MICRSLIVLSLCCAILCAFIGFLSYRAMEESDQVSTNSTDLTCREILEASPKETTQVVVSNFIVGKRKTTIDYDGDGKWDLIGVPLFPAEKQNTKYGYKALIVCCKSVPTEAEFEALWKDSAEGLTLDYWPERQELDPYLHSGLAQNYLNLDFSKSRIAFYGYERTNPIFGATSLRLSILVGGGSVAVAVLTFLIALLAKLLGRFFKPSPQTTRPSPTANRAGLPSHGGNETVATGGVLDRVRSLRDRQAGT